MARRFASIAVNTAAGAFWTEYRQVCWASSDKCPGGSSVRMPGAGGSCIWSRWRFGSSVLCSRTRAIGLGGGPRRADARMGMRWRRRLRFVIPVRVPDLWASARSHPPWWRRWVFSSEDDYDFEFRSFTRTPSPEAYFEFPPTGASRFTPDEVVLFSGGFDSLAGTIERLAVHGKR